MAFDPITAVLTIGSQLIDKLIPDPAAKAKATLDLLALQQQGNLKEIETQLSAILAEAQSSDPWTSRARPSFMYVMYLLLLAAIPMGVLSFINPEAATQIANGFGEWLTAIPDSLYTLFGVGYLGYTGARSWDKGKAASGK